jgi:hypothetical protein
MTTRFAVPAVAVATLISLSACSSNRPGALAPEPAAQLAQVARAEQMAGTHIYEGRVYSMDTSRTEPLFRYDRRVREHGRELVSTHITHDAAGQVVVTQVAQHDSAYRVTSANLIQKQSGLAGSVKAEGDSLLFTLLKDGGVKTSIEKAIHPLVTGPTMFGFIVANWDALEAGNKIPMRFAVLERNQSIGFVLDTVPGKPGQLTVRMRPSSVLVRLAVGPTYFYFDEATRNVIGYDGRVPPMEEADGKLKTLDAHVLYTFRAPSFR